MTIYNTFDNEKTDRIWSKKTLFCFKSLINHNRKMNVKVEYVQSNLVFIYAAEDIP